MANKVISIEIGNAVTRIVQMDYQTKHPKIYRHTTIPTPEGCINDGYINNDNPALADAIKKALASERMGGTKNVIFTIASSKILTREVMLPPIKASMIDATVQMNLTEYFPIDLTQHEISNVVLEHITEGDNAGRFRVLIIAAEKALIESYEALAKKMGLTLIQVDFVGNSVYQCFKNETTNRCNMVLKVEEQQTTITIIDHQNLLLQRNISYGIEEVIREVAEKPAFGVKSYEEACEYVKTNLCIFENLAEALKPSLPSMDGEERGGNAIIEARTAVTRTMAGFINAVSRVVDFYNSRYSVPIDRIFVCGMGGDLMGINTLLTNEMGIKTHVLKKLEEISWVNTTDLAGFHCYAATIGAAFAPVGLFSKAKEDKQKHKTNYKALGILLLIFSAVVSAVLFVPRFFALQDVKDENADLKAIKAQYENDKVVYDKYVNMKDVYLQVKRGSLMMENPNDGLLAFFNELEQKLPTNMNILELDSSPTECRITFAVHDLETAAGIINMFRDFDSLAELRVESFEVEHDDQNALWHRLGLAGTEEEAAPDTGDGDNAEDAEDTDDTNEGTDAEINDVDDLSEEQVKELIGEELYNEIESLPEVDDSDVDMFTEIAFTLECVYMPSFDDTVTETESESTQNTDTQTESADDL